MPGVLTATSAIEAAPCMAHNANAPDQAESRIRRRLVLMVYVSKLDLRSRRCSRRGRRFPGQGVIQLFFQLGKTVLGLVQHGGHLADYVQKVAWFHAGRSKVGECIDQAWTVQHEGYVRVHINDGIALTCVGSGVAMHTTAFDPTR